MFVRLASLVRDWECICAHLLSNSQDITSASTLPARLFGTSSEDEAACDLVVPPDGLSPVGLQTNELQHSANTLREGMLAAGLQSHLVDSQIASLVAAAVQAAVQGLDPSSSIHIKMGIVSGYIE